MFKLGIDRLDEFMDLFKGKKVGLITNPTGVDSNLRLTADILSEKTNLTTLFGPEHGVRGNAEAGAHVDSYFDPKLKIEVHSLYGQNRRPSDLMLKDVEVLCYDMQDVGLRFYTYIYTMAHAMTAAKALGLKFVVFDRPNPLGGKVEGNILDITYRSFVGYYALTQRYGLTVGELALLFNDIFEINCDLTVIPMLGYDRNKDFSSYNLPWLAPSPNLPTLDSAFLYAATVIFEGTNISEGRGTTRPFSMIGAPFIDSDELASKVKALNIEGIRVRPIAFTPNMSKHQGLMCNGIELFLTNKDKFLPVQAGFKILNVIRETYEAFTFLPPWKQGGHQMIDLLTGNSNLRLGKDLNQIFEGFIKDEIDFKKMTARFHLYE